MPVQPCGSRPPFFYAPPAGCTALGAAKYARHLGKDQPVYGLQPLGFEKGEVPHNRVEDMAEYYLREIRTLQPEGPYYLGGTCFGASVAFEMARQLQAQGCTVGLLALFDPGPPRRTAIPWSKMNMAAKIVHYVSRAVYSLWKGQFFHIAIRLLFKKIEKIFDSQKRRINVVWAAQVSSLKEYTPHVYTGKTLLFRSSEHYDEEQKGKSIWARNWSEFAVGDFHCHVIQGTHTEVLSGPQFQKLAEQFKIYLEKTQQETESTCLSSESPLLQ